MTTSDTQSALLAAILADPASDDARLVYADWLEENGQPERAEFIRVQVELARIEIPISPWCKRCGWAYETCTCGEKRKPEAQIRLTALRQRERELFVGVWRWIPLCFDGKNGAFWTVSREGTATRHYVLDRVAELKWSRGFVSHVNCTAEDWLRHHESLYRHPKQTVECPQCRGEGWCVGGTPLNYPTQDDCDKCERRGRIPRPFVPTAQPIERVVLTTEPDWSGGWPEFPDGYRLGATEVKLDRWPGITFESPM